MPDSPIPRILIVEDEPTLAFMLEELLNEAGFKVGGVASRLAPALAMIEGGPWDAAVLDTNLAGVSAAPAALALLARGVPFLVLSGYSADQQDNAFSRSLRLQKPCPPGRIIRALQSVLPARFGPKL